MTTKQHGGSRPNSGRKPIGSAPMKSRAIRLSDAHWAAFKKLGGPAWLRREVQAFITIGCL